MSKKQEMTTTVDSEFNCEYNEDSSEDEPFSGDSDKDPEYLPQPQLDKQKRKSTIKDFFKFDSAKKMQRTDQPCIEFEPSTSASSSQEIRSVNTIEEQLIKNKLSSSALFYI